MINKPGPDRVHRRTFLAVAASVAVAGCSGDGDGDTDTTASESVSPTASETQSSGDGPTPKASPPDSPTPTATESPTPTATESPTPQPASFEVVDHNAPEKAEVNEKFDWSVTFKNTGDKEGTLETPILLKTEEEDWTTLDTTNLTIPPGEEKSYAVEDATFPYITDVTLRVDKFTYDFTISFKQRTLNFGQVYTDPNDVKMKVRGIDLQTTYMYEGFGGETREESASDGHKWAFIDFWAKNTSDEQKWVPLESEVKLRTGNTQYDYKIINKEEGAYEGGEVSPGIVQEGWIAYEVPEDLQPEDFAVEYLDDNFTYNWGVRWSSQ